MKNKLEKIVNSENVSDRIRCEINSHKESGYLNVVVDKNDDGDYVLKYTCFTKLDRRKVKWAGEIVDQRKVFLFQVHDLSTDMVYKGYLNTPENIISKCVPDMSSYFDINYAHQLNDLLAEYLISHFTLYELYVLFFQYQNVFGFDVVREAKRVAIESIDSETDLLTPEQVKRLKKMVWDMNKIWFGLILNFVMVSNLFWDEKTENIIRPELKLSK
ncbi:MAG: hypothetical protein JXB49_20190 [Bacteroidales bacterium]|nr:hypothetical protein [Bacteroidales bacterium]